MNGEPSPSFHLFTPPPRADAPCAFVLLAALAWLLPHPPNFAPIAARALFGSAQFA